jgi:hypothetical protein
MRSAARISRIAMVMLLVPAVLFAQPTASGQITGSVRMPDGTVIPGVTVTATSAMLQGSRVAWTTEAGDYILRGLPPGRYNVRFEIEGMRSVERLIQVELGGALRLDAQMASVADEAITVTATAPTTLTTTEVASNYRADEIERLPLPNRTLSTIAIYTPGVTANTFNAAVGQVRIQGAFAYDNIFLVDGTDINDNLFAFANNLYIEDAVAETRVYTAGISAEFGRFTGGVINAVTKSGGNEFSGSIRGDFTNPAWTDETPFEKARKIQKPDLLSEIYQATLGGPIMRDRLWFFLAGRRQETTATQSLPALGTNVNVGISNQRTEGKLTATFENHSLQGNYMDSPTTMTNIPSFVVTTDPLGIQPSYSRPNTRWAAFYNGLIASQLFAEVKYSQKHFGFRGGGGTSTIVIDSPFITRSGTEYHYNHPYFDTTDPEDRDNRDWVAAVSYFSSTAALGSHDIKAGYENYASSRRGGNSQTATGYVYFANFAMDGTSPRMVNGRFVPIFIPFPQAGFTLNQNWFPSRGAELTITTQSFYVNDNWNLNQNFQFNLGGRYEQVGSTVAGAQADTFNASRFSPRLGASYDVRGDGRLKLDATYAEYSGKYSENQFGANTPVGSPSVIVLAYTGPPCQGFGCTEAFTITPAHWMVVGGSFPAATVFYDDNIKSPVVKEWTLGVGSALGRFGFAKLLYSNREYSSFVETFVDTTTGFTQVQIGDYNPAFAGVREFDNVLYRNTDVPVREYESIQLLSHVQPLERWTFALNYTHELKHHGSFVGEATNRPGQSSTYGLYPEYYIPERHYPHGRLPAFQAHRITILNSYRHPLGLLGNLDFGLIYTYDSPLTYSLIGDGVPNTAAQRAALTAAGYRTPPTSQSVFFGRRGIGEFNEQQQVDLALTWGLPLFGRVEPWVKVDILNATNEATLRTFDTGVSANTTAGAPRDANGLPTTYMPATTFGQATSAANYQAGRTYQLAAGIRF